MFAASPVAMALMMGDVYEDVNAAFCELLGYPREKLVGLNAYELIAPEDRAKVGQRHDARRRGGSAPEAYELTARRGDGTAIRIEIEPRVISPTETVIIARPLGERVRDRELLLALSELQTVVQRQRSLGAVLESTVLGLMRLGFNSSVVRLEGDHVTQQGYAATPELQAVMPRMPFPGAGGTDGTLEDVPVLKAALAEDRSIFLDDFAARLEERHRRKGLPPPDFGEHTAMVRALRLVIAPLKVGTETWGALMVVADKLRSNDAAAIALFASQVASAIDVAQTLAALERRNRTLEALQQVAMSGANLGVRPLCEQVLPIVEAATRSDAAALYLADERGGELVLTACTRPGRLSERYPRVPIVNSATGNTATKQRARAFSLEEWPSPSREDVRIEGFLQMGVIPLVVNSRLEGTINLSRKRDERFTEEELRSAEAVGAQVALQIERARLFEDLEGSYRELTVAQQELVKRERLAALGELSAVVAHEVRNPLGVIFNSVASLRRSTPATEEAQMLLRIVNEEAERLNRMVSDLLDFARPSEARFQPERLEPILVGAVEAAARALPTSNVEVRVEPNASVPSVPVDAELIRQAVVNLVVNAVQAMPRGGHVTLRTSRAQRAGTEVVRIDVADDGPGMPPEVAGQVFQPFFTTRAAGTGLGLAVVKRIADAHRADVSVETQPGGGATFSLFLPLSSAGRSQG
ncbi:MAG: ATP-binding protein [Myxococcaceae bacterium]